MPTSNRLSWVAKRAMMAARPELHDFDAACCEVISYDAAADRGMSNPEARRGWDHMPSHAGFVRRCAVHAPPPPLRTWILDIPLYRFKAFMNQRQAFMIDTLRTLLPKDEAPYVRS